MGYHAKVGSTHTDVREIPEMWLLFSLFKGKVDLKLYMFPSLFFGFFLLGFVLFLCRSILMT